MKVIIVACLALLCVQLSCGRITRNRRDTEENVATTQQSVTAAPSEESSTAVILDIIDISPISIDNLGASGLDAFEANINALSNLHKLNDYGLADAAFIPNLPRILREKGGQEA